MRKLLVLALLAMALGTFGTSTAWAGKQTICHFPPGDPANFHTITVSDNAVAAHVNNHGDLLGSCLANCETICDDGNACTIDVVPDLDQCVCLPEPRPSVDCDDGNECTADACDPTNGTCTNDPGPLDGNPCDDGDPNTTGEACSAGSCVACPCFTLADLVAAGTGTTIAQCGDIPGFSDLAGVIWGNGQRACSGTSCAVPPPQLTCAISTPVLTIKNVTAQEDQNCRSVIYSYCPDLSPVAPLTSTESTTPFIGN